MSEARHLAGRRRAAWRRATAHLALACLVAAHAAAAQPAPPAATPLHRLGVASPYRLPAAARNGTIRYRVVTPTAWYWPETGEQHVEPDGDGIWLTVCPECGQEAPPDPAQLERLRRPSLWLPSGDALLRSFARRSRAGSVEARMARLVDAVRMQLDGPVEYDRYLDARAAFDARRADCTEYALLLATLARAEGLATRVVAGIAYGSRFVGQPHAFGPHMWVQVWDGERWRSHDAGLARFDAGHLALAISEDGAPESLRGVMELIPTLRIVDAEGLRAPPRDAAPLSSATPAR
jgi:hypothetical protein